MENPQPIAAEEQSSSFGALSPTTNEPPQTEEEETEGLEQEYRILAARRARLLREKEIEAIRNDIAVLERQTSAPPILTPPAADGTADTDIVTSTQDTASQANSTQRAEAAKDELIAALLKRVQQDSFETPPPKRRAKLEPLPEYIGKTVRAHNDWIERAELAFRLDPERFPTEASKIDYSLQYIKGTPRTLWFQKEAENPGILFTWQDLKTFY
jgi:hypothetical protein